MLQFLLVRHSQRNNTQEMDYIVGLKRLEVLLKCKREPKVLSKQKAKQVAYNCFPLHSPLLRESWLVSIFALRWLICLSLARILAWADKTLFFCCMFYLTNKCKQWKKKIQRRCVIICGFCFLCFLLRCQIKHNVQTHAKLASTEDDIRMRVATNSHASSSSLKKKKEDEKKLQI